MFDFTFINFHFGLRDMIKETKFYFFNFTNSLRERRSSVARKLKSYILVYVPVKGTFLSEDNDVFVITPSRRTFFFPETENLNFGD